MDGRDEMESARVTLKKETVRETECVCVCVYSMYVYSCMTYVRAACDFSVFTRRKDDGGKIHDHRFEDGCEQCGNWK